MLCGDFRTEAAPPLGKEDRTTTQGNEFDFGSSVMFIALALFAWSRMRA